MADPTKYVPGYSYTDFQESTPTVPLPADEVDNDLAEISNSIDEIVEAIKDVRRSDGALKNAIVTTDSLSDSVKSWLRSYIAVGQDLASVDEVSEGVATFIAIDEDGGVVQSSAVDIMALSTPDSAQSLRARSARLNIGLDGAGAVLAVGRNANNSGADYSGLQIGGGYVVDGVAVDGLDGIIFGNDDHSSWLRAQPSKNLSPIEFLIYPTMAQGIGSVSSGGNTITFVSGTSFSGFAVGKKIYIDEGVYLISANTGTVITVTTTSGGAVSFASTGNMVFHYGYISGTGTCSVSGSTVTRIAGDPFIAFITPTSFSFKINGVARTVSSFTDNEHYVLSAAPGNTASATYTFEVDINDQITTFRLQKMLGSSEENLSFYARYDGYWIASQYAGSGSYRDIFLTSGEYTGGNPYRQIAVHKNGELSLGGTYTRDALRILAPPATPVSGVHLQAAGAGLFPAFRVRSDGSPNADIGLGIDAQGDEGVALRITNNNFNTTLFEVHHNKFKSMTLPAYADDVAAAAGGIAVGEWFHSTTSGAIRQRRS
jgi:hypothetical protein